MLEQTGDGFAQSPAEQRMIVGDHQTILHDFTQPDRSFDSTALAGFIAIIRT